jgi:cytochrome c5
VATADSAYPPAGNRSTDDGRLVWLGTCESCHAYGIAGAPNPSKPDDWAERLLKARSALYQNAISGFFGPGDTYMPPKGGNEQLTDEQVKSAVDYMLEFTIQNLQQQETKQ